MITPSNLNLRWQQADEYSAKNNLPKWGCRVAWLVVSEGVPVARTACYRYNKASPARACYNNLIDLDIIRDDPTEGPVGIVYTKHPKWEEGDGPLLWLNAIAWAAAGNDVDPLL